VAIAHDIRSPLCSILLLVDALRRAEKMSPNPIRERQLGLIYGAAFGLSTTVSNLIGAARGDGLVQGQPLPLLRKRDDALRERNRAADVRGERHSSGS